VALATGPNDEEEEMLTIRLCQALTEEVVHIFTPCRGIGMLRCLAEMWCLLQGDSNRFRDLLKLLK